MFVLPNSSTVMQIENAQNLNIFRIEHPKARAASGPECTTSRDDRVACNKLVGGRATPEDQ